MSARRWPIITLGLIAINVVVFLGTHSTMERQRPQLWEVQTHILLLAARHPQLASPPEVGKFLDDFRRYYPHDWADMHDPGYNVVDEWDAKTRQIEDPAALQAEMDSLAEQYSQLMSTSIGQRYGFVAAHPRAIAYLTAPFLHGGWDHLLGNMWFLWLAGFVLEDAWGRPLYLLVYLVAGATGAQFDAWTDPGRLSYGMGASGAISGLMGAFLVRFPKKKIRMTWVLFPFHRFWVPAYLVLPVSIFLEINDALGPKDGIGHWVHVGGFLFGVTAAVVLRYSGLERRADKAIEEKIAWTPEPEIARANDLMESGKLDQAIAVLNQYLTSNPESYAAWNLLRATYWRASNIPAYREATGKLCELHVKAMEWEAAWQDYEDFLNAGGEDVPPNVRLGLCRAREERQEFLTAASEFEKLATVCPSQRESLLAQLGAARLYLKRLNRPQDALRLYEAASVSAIPHLDLERDIQMGIHEARDAL